VHYRISSMESSFRSAFWSVARAFIRSPAISWADRWALLLGLLLPALLLLSWLRPSLRASFGGLVFSKEPTLGIVRAGEGALAATLLLVSGTDSDSEFCGRDTDRCGEGTLSPFAFATTDPLSAGRWGPWARSLGGWGAEVVASLGSI